VVGIIGVGGVSGGVVGRKAGEGMDGRGRGE
jgi:hypothetical protein